jgi:hypothetical protein
MCVKCADRVVTRRFSSVAQFAKRVVEETSQSSVCPHCPAHASNEGLVGPFAELVVKPVLLNDASWEEARRARAKEAVTWNHPSSSERGLGGNRTETKWWDGHAVACSYSVPCLYYLFVMNNNIYIYPQTHSLLYGHRFHKPVLAKGGL